LLDVIVEEDLNAGHHQAEWSAEGLPGGLYLFVLEAGDVRLVRKGGLMK